MTNSKKYSKILIIFIILILICLFLVYYFSNKKEFFDDLLTCTMTLDNINPMFKNTYMLFNNQKVLCGPCKKGVLNMVVNSCDVDEDGSSEDSCLKKGQKAAITSSFGNPITFVGNVTPENLSNFFCINV
jgi:hypothetical protein